MSRRHQRPSRVIRIADHLDELLLMLSEEVGCAKSEALDAIIEDWLDRPRDRQPKALLAALAKHGHGWIRVREENAAVGVAIDSVIRPKTASQYLTEIETLR